MYARERAVPRPRKESHRRLTGGTPLEQYAGGRQCSLDGCTAKLSRYNPSDRCSIHRGWIDPATRSYG